MESGETEAEPGAPEAEGEGELATPESEDDPDILRCAKLATRTGALDEALLDKCLRSAGIDPETVEIPAVAE